MNAPRGARLAESVLCAFGGGPARVRFCSAPGPPRELPPPWTPPTRAPAGGPRSGRRDAPPRRSPSAQTAYEKWRRCSVACCSRSSWLRPAGSAWSLDLRGRRLCGVWRKWRCPRLRMLGHCPRRRFRRRWRRPRRTCLSCARRSRRGSRWGLLRPLSATVFPLRSPLVELRLPGTSSFLGFCTPFFCLYMPLTAPWLTLSRFSAQVKPHLFTHTKHRIAQLETLLSQREA